MGNQIHQSCQIGAGTLYGHNTVIAENVRIGVNCRIGHGVVIHPDTVIGNEVRIDDNSVIGKLPMKAALSAITQEQELPPCEIADNCLIGALTILYRGCKLGTKAMVADMASIRGERGSRRIHNHRPRSNCREQGEDWQAMQVGDRILYYGAL